MSLREGLCLWVVDFSPPFHQGDPPALRGSPGSGCTWEAEQGTHCQCHPRVTEAANSNRVARVSSKTTEKLLDQQVSRSGPRRTRSTRARAGAQWRPLVGECKVTPLWPLQVWPVFLPSPGLGCEGPGDSRNSSSNWLHVFFQGTSKCTRLAHAGPAQTSTPIRKPGRDWCACGRVLRYG